MYMCLVLYFFQRLLPLEGSADMFPKLDNLSCGNKVFTIRPCYPEDKVCAPNNADLFRYNSK